MSLDNFGGFFINIILSVINGFIGIFLSPIVSAINGLLSATIYVYNDDISIILSRIDVVVNNVIMPNLIWCINIFPPFTFQVMLLIFGLWLFTWGYEFTCGIVIRVVKLVKSVVPLA